jgi:hypothetical protein
MVPFLFSHASFGSESPSATAASSNALPEISIPQLSLPEAEPERPRLSQKLRLEGHQDVPAPYASLAVPAFIFALFGPFGALPALICAHCAQRELRRNPHLRGQALIQAALIMGYISLAIGLGMLTFYGWFRSVPAA